MPNIKMLATRTGSTDGVNIQTFEAGKVYAVPYSLAANFCGAGDAEPTDEETKAEGAAPENKALGPAPENKQRVTVQIGVDSEEFKQMMTVIEEQAKRIKDCAEAAEHFAKLASESALAAGTSADEAKAAAASVNQAKAAAFPLVETPSPAATVTEPAPNGSEQGTPNPSTLVGQEGASTSQEGAHAGDTQGASSATEAATAEQANPRRPRRASAQED